MVPDTPDVEAALFSENGVAAGLSAGKTVVDMSTSRRSPPRRSPQKINALGCDYLDAPVSGGEVGAKNATLTIMVGGDEAVFARVKPLFELMGKNITLVGGNGDGQTTKVANQIIVALNIEAVAEALLFAAKAGADPARVRQALMGGFASSKILEVHGERMIKRTFDPGFRIALHQKDLNLALSSARALGVALPNTATAQELFNACAAHGGKAWDHSAHGAGAGKAGQLRDRPGRRAAPRPHDGLAPRHGDLLRRMFDAAIASAQPALCIPPHLPAPPPGAGRLVVIGAGKASAAMARAVEDALARARCAAWSSRATATPCPAERIEIVEAAHPVPDAAGLRCRRAHAAAGRGPAGRRPGAVPDLRRRLGAAAAARAGPDAGRQAGRQPRAAAVGRHDRRDELRAPPPVGHQGRAAGRGLPPGARADAADLRRARRRPDRHRLGPDRGRPHAPAPTRWPSCGATASSCRPRCATCLESGRGESVKPGDPRLARAETAHDRHAADGAGSRRGGGARGRRTRPTSWATPSKARRATSARCWPASRCRWPSAASPSRAPCVLLSGGETTVTVRGHGRGGRNVEFLLSLGIALDGHPRIHALAGDTDGVDGQEEIAGALLAPDSLARAWALGCEPAATAWPTTTATASSARWATR